MEDLFPHPLVKVLFLSLPALLPPASLLPPCSSSSSSSSSIIVIIVASPLRGEVWISVRRLDPPWPPGTPGPLALGDSDSTAMRFGPPGTPWTPLLDNTCRYQALITKSATGGQGGSKRRTEIQTSPRSGEATMMDLHDQGGSRVGPNDVSKSRLPPVVEKRR